MIKNVTFGELVRSTRESLNIPIRKVAAYIDIDPSTLSKIERNERNATIDLLKPLSEILKINIQELRVQLISDQIAKTLKYENNTDEILKVAEDKIQYIRQKSQKQQKITFNE